MKIIGYGSDVTSKIREFDEQQFHDIVKFVNDLDVGEFDIYETIYKSKYSSFPSETEKMQLNAKLDFMKRRNPLLETDKQGSSYEWVYINRKGMGEEYFRYYFGINPMNLYKLVEKLTEKFSGAGIPVSFKYQQEGKRKSADRIILYIDSVHKNDVERLINEVYLENKELFNNSERVLPWVYESSTPNVYLAPESVNHQKSYGEKFAAALLAAKKIYHYLYQDDKVRSSEQLEMLKKIVLSAMFRNEVLISKDGGRIIMPEQDIATFYDKEKNVLRNVIDEKNGNYYEAVFDSSFEAKKSFLENFYYVKSVVNKPGVQKRVLSRSERIREIYNFLYPQTNTNTQQSGMKM